MHGVYLRRLPTSFCVTSELLRAVAAGAGLFPLELRDEASSPSPRPLRGGSGFVLQPRNFETGGGKLTH